MPFFYGHELQQYLPQSMLTQSTHANKDERATPARNQQTQFILPTFSNAPFEPKAAHAENKRWDCINSGVYFIRPLNKRWRCASTRFLCISHSQFIALVQHRRSRTSVDTSLLLLKFLTCVSFYNEIPLLFVLSLFTILRHCCSRPIFSCQSIFLRILFWPKIQFGIS